MQFQYLFNNPKKKKKKSGKKVAKKKVAKKVAKKKSSKKSSKRKVAKKKVAKKFFAKKSSKKKVAKKATKSKVVFKKNRRLAKKRKKNPEVVTTSTGKTFRVFTKPEINKIGKASESVVDAIKKAQAVRIREKNNVAKARQDASIKRLKNAMSKLNEIQNYIDISNSDSPTARDKIVSIKNISDTHYDMAVKEAYKAINAVKHIHIPPKASGSSKPSTGKKKTKEELRAIRLKALEKAREARKAGKGKAKKVKKAKTKKAKSAKKITKADAKSFIQSYVGKKKKASKKKVAKKKVAKKKVAKSAKGKSQKHQKHSKANRKLPKLSLGSLIKKLPLPSKKGKTRNFLIGSKKYKMIRLNPVGGNMEVTSLANHKTVGKAYQALNKFANMATKHELLEVSGMAMSASLMGLMDRLLLQTPAVGGVYNTMRRYGGIGVASYLAGLVGAIGTEMGAKKVSGEMKVVMEALHQISRGVISAGIVNMWQTALAPELGMAGLVQTQNMNGLVQNMNGADFGRLITDQSMRGADFGGLVQTMNGADFGGLVQTMNGADFEGMGHEADVYDYGVMNSEGEDYQSDAYDVNGGKKSAPSAYDVDDVLAGIDFE